MQIRETAESSQTPVVKATDKEKNVVLRMSLEYQPSKFQQFDGKGNPKQHIAHFVETCENAGSRGDHLVSWEQLEKKFLNRFYNIRRTKCAPKACTGDSSTFCKE
ncbi:retrotransposon gag protein [Cucumis melo var. makuwa]|uniref:Retrotransposon gag protein n=1 Tax=Cucumis melo var. makuwa TaxID=1194695 RepID=A0A5A7VJJ2_CUCMM|nr:retrotransposon gag protein [Cucumis melo var. makuwa]TYK24059.1 retrotransposon gag protein [Cucumis melo var. makuwa]